jgi:hypothetical protein
MFSKKRRQNKNEDGGKNEKVIYVVDVNFLHIVVC